MLATVIGAGIVVSVWKVLGLRSLLCGITSMYCMLPSNFKAVYVNSFSYVLGCSHLCTQSKKIYKSYETVQTCPQPLHLHSSLFLPNMSEGLIAEKPFQVLLMCPSIDHGDLATQRTLIGDGLTLLVA